MNPSLPTHLLTRFRSLTWLLVGIWTGCIAASLLWNLRQQADHSFQLARLAAQVTFDNDVLYRRWSAQQGGVYVRVSASTPPNPHLQVPARDVTTTSGLSLTLVNPAYMSRQVNALAGATAGNRGHLTSLNPIRPENAPDAWEAAALRSFEQGVPEIHSLEQMPEGEHLRFMRPFLTERSCLECHAAQGYREGDIRGGISVSVPMAPFRAIEKPMTDRLIWAHVGLWMVGLAGIGISRRSVGNEIAARERVTADLQRQVRERRLAEDELREANDRYELVTAGAEAAIWDWDVPRRRVVFSPRWKAMRGLAEDEVGDAEGEWSEGIHPEDAPRVNAAVQAHFAGQTAFFAEEYRVRRKDGSWMWIADRGLARRDAQGRVLRMAGSETDITERKQAEAALTRQREDLELILDSTPAYIFYKDRENRFVRVNRAFADVMGKPKEQLEGRSLFDLYPRAQAEAFWQADREVMTSGEPKRNIIEPMQTPAGERWVQTDKVPCRDAGGDVIGVIGFSLDITERRRAEDERRESEERYHSLFNAMTEGFALHQIATDPQGRPCDYVFLDVNPAFERLTGFHRAALLGKRMREVMPTIEGHWIEHYGRVALTGEPAHFENFAAGTGRWFEIFAYRTAPGQCAVMLADITTRKQTEERLHQFTAKLQAANASLLESRRATLNLMDDALTARQRAEQISTELRQEVAERKRAEEGLRESESFHRQTLESIPGMVFTTRPDGYCDYQSQPWVEFTGVPMSEHLGDGWNKLLHPDDRPRAFAAWREAVEGRAPYDLEYRVRRHDGAYEWFKVRGRPIHDTAGNIVRWFGTALSVEDLKRAEDHLKASLREKELLLQEVHHRVKNNLQVISSLINLQADALDQPVLRESLNDVRDRVRTMALVHEKLYQSGDLARLDFADYAAGLLHYLWRAHGDAAARVRLTLATQPVALPVGIAVPCGLILNELASNTLKHAFRGRTDGEVTVGLEREAAPHRLCLYVSDNGVGLPPDLDVRRASSLGLRLVQMLTQQIGGTVEVRTGPGTEFRVAFTAPEGG